MKRAAGAAGGRRSLPGHLGMAAVLLALALAACAEGAPRGRPAVQHSAPPAVEAALEPTAPPVVATPDGPPDVTIAAVGDLMFARRLTTLMQQLGPGYPFERVADLLDGTDLLVGNMEGTFTDRGTPLVKQYTFRTPPPLAVALAGAGFDAVSLANNHATDFGTVGLEDTLGALRDAGVRSFGAGADADAAMGHLVLTSAGGARVALVGVDDIGEVIWAGPAQAGVARADVEALRRQVEAARADADYVVVFAHWGLEYNHAPTARQRQLATAAIEAGADVVIGAHPHVLQPVERIGNGVVVYSLGNFVFDLDSDDMRTLGEGPFQSAVARVTLSRRGPPSLEVVPVRIDPREHRPRPATPEEATSILAQLREIAPAPFAPR